MEKLRDFQSDPVCVLCDGETVGMLLDVEKWIDIIDGYTESHMREYKPGDMHTRVMFETTGYAKWLRLLTVWPIEGTWEVRGAVSSDKITGLWHVDSVGSNMDDLASYDAHGKLCLPNKALPRSVVVSILTPNKARDQYQHIPFTPLRMLCSPQ